MDLWASHLGQSLWATGDRESARQHSDSGLPSMARHCPIWFDYWRLRESEIVPSYFSVQEVWD